MVYGSIFRIQGFGLYRPPSVLETKGKTPTGKKTLRRASFIFEKAPTGPP